MPGSTWTTVACTGVTDRRPQYLPPGSQQWRSGELAWIRRLRDEHGTELAHSGGPVGTDLLWAEEAHASGLVTRLYLPFPDQDTR